jgi:hypothetical protein
MAKLTRRGFIKQASVGAAAVGALSAVPVLGTSRAFAHPSPASPDVQAVEHQGPIIAHIRDAKSGEVSIYVGTREVVIHDLELVSRLVKALR